MMLVVNGKIDLDIGGNYHGAGVKMLANDDIKVKAGEKLTLETTSKEYVKYEYDKVKNNLLGKSSISLKWVSNKLANVEIEAPNGEIYISSKECVFEGVSINGKKPVIHCDKLEIKEKTYLDVITKITKKSGFLAPSIPLYDLVSGKEEVDIPLLNSAKELFDMKSLTDLAPIMKLLSEVGAFKAKFDILKAQGISKEASMIGALLSQYATATLRFGKEYIKNSVEYINVKPSIIIGDYVFIKGSDGLISGSEIRAHNDLEIEFDNLDIKSAIKQVIENLENKRVSFDIGIDLFSGVTLAATNFAAKGVRTEVNHQAAKLIAERINIKLDNKFTIIGGQINAKEVSIDALNIEIHQVIDHFSNKFSSHSESIGVTITAAGAVLPHVALNYANKEEESGYISYISGIVADKVRIIANSLTASSNAIVATDSLVKYLANYHEIEDQAPYHYDTNLEVGIKTQRGASGELDLKPTLLFAAGDGENKISSYFSTTLIDGVKYIFGELIGGAEQEDEGKTKVLSHELSNKIDEILDIVPEGDKPKVKEFSEQIKKIENNVIIVRDLPPLPGANVAGNSNSAATNAKTFAHTMSNLIGQYKEFSEQYPNLAEYGLSIVNIGIQTLIAGPLGFVNGVRSETAGYAVSKVLEEPTAALLNTLLTETSSQTKSKFPELSDKEARDFAVGIVVGAGVVISGTLAIKHILKQIDSIGFHGEVRLDVSVSPAARKFFDDIPVYERKSAEIVNMELAYKYNYKEPPFLEYSIVSVFKTNKETRFVRFFNYEAKQSNQIGRWVALYEDCIDGKGSLFSATELQSKFDLPEIPTHISKVNVPTGTELAVGIVNPGNFGGKGTGTQFYFTQNIEKTWFSGGVKN